MFRCRCPKNLEFAGHVILGKGQDEEAQALNRQASMTSIGALKRMQDYTAAGVIPRVDARKEARCACCDHASPCNEAGRRVRDESIRADD